MAFATAYPLLLLSRFTAGVCLAGVYPPALKMAATWFRARRGLAVGIAVPGLVRRRDGLVHLAPNLDWHDVGLPALVSGGK